MTSDRSSVVQILASELELAAAEYAEKREAVERLLHEVVEFDRPLEAAWLAQRIVDAIHEISLRAEDR